MLNSTTSNGGKGLVGRFVSNSRDFMSGVRGARLLRFLMPQALRSLPPAWRYAIAAAIVTVNTVLRQALNPVMGALTPYNTMPVTVVGTTLFLGTGPGLFTVFAGSVAVEAFVVGSFPPAAGVPALIRLIVSITSGTVVCGILHAIGAIQANAAKSEERYEDLLKYAPAGIYEIDLTVPGFVSVNDVMCEYLGYTREELLSIDPFDILDGHSRKRLSDMLKKAQLETKLNDVSEFKLISKDGKEYFAVFNITYKYDKGKLAGTFGIASDITLLKKIEIQLNETAEKYSTLFNNTSDGIWIHNLKGEITEVNKAFCRMCGYTRNELIGMHISKLEAVESSEDIDRRIKKVIEQGGHDRFESRHRRKDGSFFDVDVTALYYEGQEGRIAIFVRDITERKRTEEVLSRNKTILEKMVEERSKQLIDAHVEIERSKRLSDIGTLAATVAHELRNPLAVINVAAANIKRKAKNKLLDSHLESIKEKIFESNRIINNLLFYSRIQSIRPEEISINHIVKECIDISQKQLMHKKKVALEKKMDSTEGVLLKADPVQIKEVFSNILNNSYDAVPESGGRIDIYTENADRFVKVTVKDNGAGIDKEYILKVFDPFFTTKAKGTGLGLSVCRQILNLHGGAIDIESEPGKGTSVHIKLSKQTAN